MYDLVLHAMYFFVAPNPIDVTSIVIEKLSFCNDHVRVMWKVHKYKICSYVYCEHNIYLRTYVTGPAKINHVVA